MKTHGHTITLALILAVVSCGLILALRTFAQPAPTNTETEYTLTFTNAKLKKQYGDNASDAKGAFKSLLDSHGKSYSITGKDNNGKDIKHYKAKKDAATNPTASLSESNEIIRVTNTDTPAVSASVPIVPGSNVTQNVTTSSVSDMTAVLNAFQ